MGHFGFRWVVERVMGLGVGFDTKWVFGFRFTKWGWVKIWAGNELGFSNGLAQMDLLINIIICIEHINNIQ